MGDRSSDAGRRQGNRVGFYPEVTHGPSNTGRCCRIAGVRSKRAPVIARTRTGSAAVSSHAPSAAEVTQTGPRPDSWPRALEMRTLARPMTQRWHRRRSRPTPVLRLRPGDPVQVRSTRPTLAPPLTEGAPPPAGPVVAAIPGSHRHGVRGFRLWSLGRRLRGDRHAESDRWSPRDPQRVPS